MNRIIFALLVIISPGCNHAEKNDDSVARSENSDSTYKTQKKDSPFLGKYHLTALMRKTPVEVGCILQTELSYTDSKFNCSYKNYKNNGDPCVKTEEYYEGVVIPNKIAGTIHPLIEDIDLSFEHGNLREITITFKDSVEISTVKKIFSLPKSISHYPINVTDINYKPTNPNYTRWLSITGFDHVGAGDVDCK